MLILYLAVLCTGLYYAGKVLLPEMAKPVPNKPIAPKRVVEKSVAVEVASEEQPENRIVKLRNLLAEKNTNIQALQTHIKALLVQVRDSDKIKSILESEILHLREQNRIFRSELGLPAVDTKEKQLV